MWHQVIQNLLIPLREREREGNWGPQLGERGHTELSLLQVEGPWLVASRSVGGGVDRQLKRAGES